MNEIVKEHQLIKNRIENIKMRKNLSCKNIKRNDNIMTPNNNTKYFLSPRPNSNYIPNNNTIKKQFTKIFVNRLISAHKINNNSSSFIKNNNNNLSYINKIKINQRNREFCIENYAQKSARNQLKINNVLLNNEINNKIDSNINKKEIRRCLSPRNYSYNYKMIKMRKKLFSDKKNNNAFISLNSPSTTNNSNINNDNSYSSHFLFGVSTLNSNVYPKSSNNNYYIKNILNNNKKNENQKNNSNGSIKKTYIENELNKIILQKENKNKNKNYKLRKNAQNFNFEELYFRYAKKIDENSLKGTTLFRNSLNYDNKLNTNYSSVKSSNIIKSNKNTVYKINYNYDLNNYKKPKKKSNNPNLFIKYAFLNKAINNITRKVDFINPKSGERIQLDTTNIDNKFNNINNKNDEKYRKDFTSFGYEITPEYLYKLNQETLQKNRINILLEENKKENSKIFREKKEKKIKQNESKFNKKENKYKKNFTKIEIKSLKENEQKKTQENLDDKDINIYSFGLGESSEKNRINWRLLKKEEKEKGKKLWNKLNKSAINFCFNIKRRKLEYKNIKPKVICFNKNKIAKNKKRIKSAKINYSHNKLKLNSENKKGKNINSNWNNINIEDKYIRKKKRINQTLKIDTLKQHKLFRFQNQFNEMKRNYFNDKINIDFKIEENESELKSSENQNNENENSKEEEEEEEKNSETIEKNIKRSNKFFRRNTSSHIVNFENKLYKIKKNSQKNVFYNNSNINFENKKEKLKKAKPKNYNNSKLFTNKSQILKLKNKYNSDKKVNKKNINSKTLKKEKSIKNTLNSSKYHTIEVEYNNLLDELYSSFDSESSFQNLTVENDIDNNILKIEDIFIKRSNNKKKSTLLFDRYFKNFKWKDREDEEMINYYNEIFSKYGRGKDDKIVDINLFGYNFKIREKNKLNFKKNFMNRIKDQNKIKRENKIINSKLSLILDEFKNNKKKFFHKNRDIYNSSVLFKKDRKRTRRLFLKEKSKYSNKEMDKESSSELKYDNKEKLENNNNDKEEEFKSKLFLGIKIDSAKEIENKKEEILEMIKDDIKSKIIKREIGISEMNNFRNFEKRLSLIYLDINNNDNYYNKKAIKRLEEEFMIYQEQMKIREQIKKEEKRINHFINNLNDQIEQNYKLKNTQEQLFCNVIDYVQKNNINILSPTKEKLIKSN